MKEPLPAAPAKEETREYWTRRAPHWVGCAEAVAEMADRFNQPLIEAAGIGPGQRVLDLASGAGEPALTIARRVGPAGSVTLSDLVPAMLSGSEARARAAGLANVAFRQADMEALPFGDNGFDRVTCRFGLMFVPEPVRALTEARRVLVPGGRAAFMVWGPIEDTTIFTALRQAVGAVFGADSGIDLVTPFRFGRPGALTTAFEAAGLARVEEIERRFAPRVPADRPFWRPMLEMTMGARLAAGDEAARAAIEDEIRAALAPRLDGDVYRMEAHVRIGRGQAPDD